VLLRHVKLLGFRNLGKIALDVSPQINIFLGRNGQGKTNLLEGLSYLALGRSHRGNRDRELIAFGGDHFHLGVEGQAGSGDPFRLEAAVTKDGQKRLKVDGQTVARQADLVGHLSVVQFDPGDVELTKGSPDHRRRFLDYTLSVCSSEYFRNLQAYRRALAQKNRLLKQRFAASDAELDAWDQELVRTGAPLLEARLELLPSLERVSAESYADLAPAGGRLGLALRGFPREEGATHARAFAAALGAERAHEKALGHARVGPHRDRLDVSLEGRSIRRYGSQGEKRSASIALKLAQAELIYERTRERPAVFLDDIFSELDRGRTHALQARLHREHQLFIATARLDDVLAMRDCAAPRAWFVEDGTVTPIREWDGLAGRLESPEDDTDA